MLLRRLPFMQMILIMAIAELVRVLHTDYTDSRTMLNGCTGKCVRLGSPLVGF